MFQSARQTNAGRLWSSTSGLGALSSLTLVQHFAFYINLGLKLDTDSHDTEAGTFNGGNSLFRSAEYFGYFVQYTSVL